MPEHLHYVPRRRQWDSELAARGRYPGDQLMSMMTVRRLESCKLKTSNDWMTTTDLALVNVWFIASITYFIFNLIAYFNFLCAINHFTSETISISVRISILLFLFSSNLYFHFRIHSYFRFSYTIEIHSYFNTYFHSHIKISMSSSTNLCDHQPSFLQQCHR